MTRPSALKRKPRRRRGKIVNMPVVVETTSDTGEGENYTSSPTSDFPDSKRTLGTEVTVAPEIGQEEIDEKKGDYAMSSAALIDKYIFSSKSIPFVAILLIMGVIFIQDNQAGKLEDWGNILWAVQKCLFFLVLYCAFRIYRWVSGKRTR